MTPVLIVNADDYGRTEAISRGIRYGYEHGVITTTTVMMNLPAARASLLAAHEQTPGLGLGVHLNLTCGMPLCPAEEVPSLAAADGFFHSRDAIIDTGIKLDPDDVRREWTAQIEAFRELCGPPDHLDSHHHIALFDRRLWEIMLSLARGQACGVRAPLPSDLTSSELSRLFPARSTDFLRTQAATMLLESGVCAPDRFLTSFFGPGVSADHLRELLIDPQPGVTELMCHPGYADAALDGSSSYSQLRETELELLTRPDLQSELTEAGWRLSSYRDAWTAPGERH